MSNRKEQFLVGTSGWSYDHWKGVFYPEDCPKRKWFEYYTKKFSTVEVNATFYRKFGDKTYYNWRERVSKDFFYVLKAPRLITHRKYLKDVGEEVKGFCNSASLLENRLGLILLQLAPGTPYDPERLRKALLAFRDPKKVAVEFRNKKWFTEETRKLLMEVGSVFCTADSPKTTLMDWITSDIAYIRLHGRQKWYAYDYSTEELQEIAVLAKKMIEFGAKRIFIFFNNDFDGYAPKNALTLLELLT